MGKHRDGTTKKERAAMKEAKKAASRKTEEERRFEIDAIKNHLAEWGLGPNQKFDALTQLYEIMEDYCVHGEVREGSIPFPECPPQPQGRNIVYFFPRGRMNKCKCDLIVRPI